MDQDSVHDLESLLEAGLRELALFADRSGVAEELQRLTAHLAEANALSYTTQQASMLIGLTASAAIQQELQTR